MRYDEVTFRNAPVKQISTFAATPHAIADLQLFRDTDHASVAALLAACPVLLAEGGDTVSDPARPRLVIVLRGALAEAGEDASCPGKAPANSPCSMARPRPPR
jgi:hypothetical protein